MILWKISSLFWLTRNWRLGSHCLSHPYVILKLQLSAKGPGLFSAGVCCRAVEEDKSACVGFCGVAVLVTISMMCFVETIKSDSSVHWKWAQCMWSDLLLPSNRGICFPSGSVKIFKFNQGLRINVKNRIWNLQLNYQWKNKILFGMITPLCFFQPRNNCLCSWALNISLIPYLIGRSFIFVDDHIILSLFHMWSDKLHAYDSDFLP